MNEVIALDVCEKLIYFLYLEYNWFENALIYVRIRLRQLHLIFNKFSIELFPLIYVKSTFIKVNGWNFIINVLYMLWYMQERRFGKYILFFLDIACTANYFIFHNFVCTD